MQISSAGAVQPLVVMLKEGLQDSREEAARALAMLGHQSERCSTDIVNARRAAIDYHDAARL